MARIFPSFEVVQRPHGLLDRNRPAAPGARGPVDLIEVDAVGFQIFEGPVAGGDHLVVLQVIGKTFVM